MKEEREVGMTTEIKEFREYQKRPSRVCVKGTDW